MQKKLIALAVAGMFAAPAFAATSNVDVYGSINVSIDRVNDGDDSWMRMVTNNNSFIGFKGSEDLGGGLSAVWQIESNINIDGNQSNAADAGNIFGTRNTFLGLSSKGFGTILAGVHDTPYKMSTGPLDLFVGTLGDYNGIMGNQTNFNPFGPPGALMSSNPSAVFDLRTGNTIAYLSPNFGGFDVKAAYVMGGEGNDKGADTSRAYSLSATYKNGPLFVTGAYEKHDDLNINGTTAACNAGATCLGFNMGAAVPNTVAIEREAWKIGLGYTMGAFQVGLMYENQDNTWATTDYGHSAWMLNAAYTMGAMKLKAEYLKAGESDAVDDTGATMWAVGMDYSMSKRTMLQLTYARLSNDTYGAWSLGQGPSVAPITFDETVSGFSVGVKHTF